MPDKSSLTVREAIQLALWELDKPIEKKELIRRVLEIRPSSAKTAASSIGNALRWDMRHEAFTLDDGKIISVGPAMNGLRFRLPLSDRAVERGSISLTGFFPFVRDYMNPELLRRLGQGDLALRASSGEKLPVKISSVKVEIESPGRKKPQTVTVPTVDLSDWLRAKGAKAGDSILVTIQDWDRRSYTLEWEPSAEKRLDVIVEQNALLVEKVYQLVGESEFDHTFAAEVIPTAYARLGDAVRGYPGDHWTLAVTADGRVGINDSGVMYLARYETGTEYEPDGYEGEAEVHAPDSVKQDLVFVFKASFPYRKGLWRRLELLGSNTLADFDGLMHTAFEHDYDHLSEFRVKPKDRGKRARWEGFGPHNPFEGSAADDIQITQLGLEMGDRMNYVYDFGDWVEHDLVLETIQPREAEIEYPRVASQNKPRYQKCVSCAQRGIETRAVWDCISCSNDQQRDVFVCEECAAKEHEDHYVEPILY